MTRNDFAFQGYAIAKQKQIGPYQAKQLDAEVDALWQSYIGWISFLDSRQYWARANKWELSPGVEVIEL